MRIASTVALLALAIAGVTMLSTAPHTGADEPVESGEFWFDPDPEHVLISARFSNNQTANVWIYDLFADGHLTYRLTTQRGEDYDNTVEQDLSFEDTRALVGLAVDGRLMDYEAVRVRAAMGPVTHYRSHTGTVRLKIDLPHYQRPGQDDAPAVIEISVGDVAGKAKRYPNIPEIQALSTLFSALRSHRKVVAP